MTTSAEKIKKQQQAWAQKRGIAFDEKGHVLNLNDNLFEPLLPDAKSEYESGAGGELEGKMRALHSSSALVCNLFHYWRYRDIGIVAKACGLSSDYTSVTFEKTYRKPPEVPGIPPHVDVEFAGRTLKPVAVEAKFSEQYSRSKKTLKRIYVMATGIWGNLSGCESLAYRIVDSREVFQYMDASQLLKHILGLKTAYGEQGFELLYLWYKLDGEEALEHKREIERFESYVVSDLSFRTITYQEVFQEIKLHVAEHPDYMNYMKERYF